MWKKQTLLEFSSSDEEFDIDELEYYQANAPSDNEWSPDENNHNNRTELIANITQSGEWSSSARTDHERAGGQDDTTGVNPCKERSSQENFNVNQQNECSWSDIEEMEKPQLKFDPKVDNSTSPFKPSLRSKPNAIQPLEIHEECDKDGTKHYCHPYKHELNVFEVPSHQLKKNAPIPPSNIGSNDGLTIVDDSQTLALMIADLEDAREIAIDSEYHHYRSFFGFLCVLQISTRTRDYIVDTIALRSKLEVLNKFFTDPKILKVMHAASSDVLWLQKDLNLYLVNMFDTSLAATELGSRQSGLANILKQYCDITIEKNKDFQKHYDWRERPLTSEAISYTRDDSHYLLYLHDILRNKLIAKSNTTESLLKVYKQCTDLCKKTYRKPPSGLPALLRKHPNDYRKRHAMKSLYEWRDNICREMDESTGYVLCNRVLLQLVEKLPETVEEIENVFWPSDIGSIVRTHLPQFLELIADARKQPVVNDNLPRSNDKKVKETRSQGTQTENVEDICSQSTQTVVRMRSQSTQTEITDVEENATPCHETIDWW